MSRNLSTTSCEFCSGEVRLAEPARPITRDDCGVYYDTHEGYGYAGAVVANAECVDCLAKYLAWIDLSACAGYGQYKWTCRSTEEGKEFFDLSFRSTFNDEPGEEDLPVHRVEVITIRNRHPWPTCNTCKKRIYSCYGCQCPAAERETEEVAQGRIQKERLAYLEEQRQLTAKSLEEFGEVTRLVQASSDAPIAPATPANAKRRWSGDLLLDVLNWVLAEQMAGRRPNDHDVAKQFNMSLKDAVELHDHLEEIGEF